MDACALNMSASIIASLEVHQQMYTMYQCVCRFPTAPSLCKWWTHLDHWHMIAINFVCILVYLGLKQQSWYHVQSCHKVCSSITKTTTHIMHVHNCYTQALIIMFSSWSLIVQKSQSYVIKAVWQKVQSSTL